MSRPERVRGVTVDIIDMTPLCERVRDELHDKRGKTEIQTVSARYRFARAANQGGELFLLCDEGVIWRCDQNDPASIDFWDDTPQVRVEDGKEVRMMNMFPTCTADVRPDDIKDLPVTESVDLADFVRRFGDRLERNFEVCRDLLTGGLARAAARRFTDERLASDLMELATDIKARKGEDREALLREAAERLTKDS